MNGADSEDQDEKVTTAEGRDPLIGELGGKDATAVPGGFEIPAENALELESAGSEAVEEPPPPVEWKPVVEALLFASAEPLTLNALRKMLTGASAESLKVALRELRTEYDDAGRGVTLLEVAGGWMIVTRESCAPWVEKMLKGRRRVRLSRAALETVAVVAYRQPISRLDVERIRGVDCGGVLATLVERDLVMIKGRDSGPGKPLLYGTTQDFLNYFGLNRLSELPRLDEISTLAARNPAWTDTERARFEKAGLEDMPEEIPGFQAPETVGETWVEVADRAAQDAGLEAAPPTAADPVAEAAPLAAGDTSTETIAPA